MAIQSLPEILPLGARGLFLCPWNRWIVCPMGTMRSPRPFYRRVIMQSGAFSYWNAQPMEDAESQFHDLLVTWLPLVKDVGGFPTRKWSKSDVSRPEFWLRRSVKWPRYSWKGGYQIIAGWKCCDMRIGLEAMWAQCFGATYGIPKRWFCVSFWDIDLYISLYKSDLDPCQGSYQASRRSFQGHDEYQKRRETFWTWKLK